MLFRSATSDAKRRGENVENYSDMALYGIVFAILGARLYYVIFRWDYYGKYPLEILNIKKEDLTIYEGVIAAVLTLIIFTKKRNLSFFKMADSLVLGLITGQIIGRWGNFFNAEAFGGYTNNLFAMQIKKSIVNDSMISADLMKHLVNKIGRAHV